MYLLRFLFLTVLAVTLSLVLPHTALAVDHPWDGLTPDTTHVSGVNQRGDVPITDPIIQIIPRALNWARGIINQFRILLFGQNVKGQTVVVPRNGQDKQQNATVNYRKYK